MDFRWLFKEWTGWGIWSVMVVNKVLFVVASQRLSKYLVCGDRLNHWLCRWRDFAWEMDQLVLESLTIKKRSKILHWEVVELRWGCIGALLPSPSIGRFFPPWSVLSFYLWWFTCKVVVVSSKLCNASICTEGEIYFSARKYKSNRLLISFLQGNNYIFLKKCIYLILTPEKPAWFLVFFFFKRRINFIL